MTCAAIAARTQRVGREVEVAFKALADGSGTVPVFKLVQEGRPTRPPALPTRNPEEPFLDGFLDRINTEPAYTTPDPACAARPRVEQVPHGVTEHVQTVNGNSQGKTRPERQPWRHLHRLPGVGARHRGRQVAVGRRLGGR